MTAVRLTTPTDTFASTPFWQRLTAVAAEQGHDRDHGLQLVAVCALRSGGGGVDRRPGLTAVRPLPAGRAGQAVRTTVAGFLTRLD
jgi:hypothetical protein